MPICQGRCMNFFLASVAIFNFIIFFKGLHHDHRHLYLKTTLLQLA